MKIKLKPNTYYKDYYHTITDLGLTPKMEYNIVYTDTKWVYIIADMRINEPIYKHDKKYKWGTIREWQENIDLYSIKIEEMSKEDVFLELL